jgi:amidase
MIRLTRSQIVYAFDKTHPPVATVDPGTEMLFETWDSRTGTIHSEEQTYERPHPRGPNPATGPVFVRGAEPGDALVVTILDIQLDRRGHTGLRPGKGLLPHLSHRYRVRLLDVVDGTVVFNDRIRFPVRPMIGVIGTAPAGEAVANMHPGPHGGNMDHTDVRLGAAIHLPVFVPGGLLALGDVHATMGDGEISITALESCAEVRVRVELAKGESIRRPWIDLPESWVTTGDGPGIGDAIKVAADEMATFLGRRLGLSQEDAYMLLSIRGDMRVGQCAEPSMIAATARVVMPKLSGTA